MAKSNDWLPSKRTDQLAMAKTWRTVLGAKKLQFQITDAQLSELDDIIEDAENWLGKAMSSDRTAVITAQCKGAFDHMINFMRDLKNRKFFSPPFYDPDFIALGLKPKDTNPTPVAPPTGQAEADITYPGPHLLMLHIKPIAGTLIDPKADYGYRIYYGILPPGGATPEQATSQRRYLSKATPTGADLPHSKFTRRKKELFDFPADDSGKTAYFCIRYENSKGQSGPWGPVFNAVIP